MPKDRRKNVEIMPLLDKKKKNVLSERGISFRAYLIFSVFQSTPLGFNDDVKHIAGDMIF